MMATWVGGEDGILQEEDSSFCFSLRTRDKGTEGKALMFVGLMKYSTADDPDIYFMISGLPC